MFSTNSFGNRLQAIANLGEKEKIDVSLLPTGIIFYSYLTIEKKIGNGKLLLIK